MAVGHRTPHIAFKIFFKHVFGMTEISELFWLLLKALVRVEEAVSVEDALLNSAQQGKKNMLKCFWF